MQRDKKKNDEAEILLVTKQLTELMIKKDTVGINKITDARFTLTHITGYVQPKSEWFAEIESDRMKYYAYEEVTTSVTFNGNKAISIGRNILDARIWGTRNNWRLQQTIELEKKNNQWIIQKSVATTF